MWSILSQCSLSILSKSRYFQGGIQKDIGVKRVKQMHTISEEHCLFFMERSFCSTYFLFASPEYLWNAAKTKDQGRTATTYCCKLFSLHRQFIFKGFNIKRSITFHFRQEYGVFYAQHRCIILSDLHFIASCATVIEVNTSEFKRCI